MTVRPDQRRSPPVDRVRVTTISPPRRSSRTSIWAEDAGGGRRGKRMMRVMLDTPG